MSVERPSETPRGPRRSRRSHPARSRSRGRRSCLLWPDTSPVRPCVKTQCPPFEAPIHSAQWPSRCINLRLSDAHRLPSVLSHVVVRDLQPAWSGAVAARSALLRRNDDERRALATAQTSAAASTAAAPAPSASGSISLDPRGGIAPASRGAEGKGKSPSSQQGSSSSPRGALAGGAAGCDASGSDGSLSFAAAGRSGSHAHVQAQAQAQALAHAVDTSASLSASLSAADWSLERSAEGSAVGAGIGAGGRVLPSAPASLSASATAADTTADLSLSRSTTADFAAAFVVSDGPRWTPQPPPRAAASSGVVSPPPLPPLSLPPMTDEERAAAVSAGMARALTALLGRVLAAREAVALGGAAEAPAEAPAAELARAGVSSLSLLPSDP